ncbi:MAG: hypothetical protein ACJ8M4_11785 [Chthoniobacterales bacterium]
MSELAFFFLADADGLDAGVSEGVGVSLDFFFGEGDGDFSGDAVGFGVGDFSAVDFFFVCFRGAGVGVGSKIFFNCVPNDCAAKARGCVPATNSNTQIIASIPVLRRISIRT